MDQCETTIFETFRKKEKVEQVEDNQEILAGD